MKAPRKRWEHQRPTAKRLTSRTITEDVVATENNSKAVAEGSRQQAEDRDNFFIQVQWCETQHAKSGPQGRIDDIFSCRKDSRVLAFLHTLGSFRVSLGWFRI